MGLHVSGGLACCAVFTLVSSMALCASAATPVEGHVFYYGWYGNPETDGNWRQWNHQISLREGNGGSHKPPEDIGSNFYPADGLYSSNSREDVARQMRQLKQAGCGVAAATWWGVNDYSNKSMEVLFDVAAEHDIKVCFHIEPFQGRSAATVREALIYLLDKYGKHPALYRCTAKNNLPMIYIYDSYLVPAEEWATLFKPNGEITVRNTEYDVVSIGLWVKEKEEAFMLEGGFDGFYTYFASDGFTYGSTPANWPHLAKWAKENNLLFIPSVAPGYIDICIRPWNAQNTRARENGAYYDRMFKAALDIDVPIVSITSFNEWHEGTQIEPAIPKKTTDFVYEDYGDKAPEYYLEQTRYWLEKQNEKK